MITPVLLLALSCPKTQYINQTNEAWNPHDIEVSEYCSKRCGMEYSDAPCLKRFIKKNHNDYYCGCGPSAKEKK